jgi:hypothetical protein
MKSSHWKRILFYCSVITLMIFASLQFDFGTSAAGVSCCTYGADCGRTKTCCTPDLNQRDCSASVKNYCRRSCGPLPD